MRVLISAFHCTPDSEALEARIGWQWVTTLARAGRDLTVLTQSRNRDVIEAWLAAHREVTISFGYIPSFGENWFARTLWQVFALIALLRTGEWRDFDLIHHLTPGSIRSWSFLWLLRRPFSFGPVGGGERAPMRYFAPMGAGPVTLEVLRRVLLRLSFADPVFVAMQGRAAQILLRTADTAGVLWPRFRTKTTVGIAIGAPEPRAEPHVNLDPPVRVLFAAPLRYWTGGDIFADVAAEIESRGRRYELILVGAGPRQAAIDAKLKRIRHLKIVSAPTPTQEELTTLYRGSDILAVPSLRDGKGDAVLDAMVHAIPVVCFDLGAPAAMVGNAGEVVSTVGKNYQDAVRDFADAIVRLAEDAPRRAVAAQRARERADRLSWDAAAREGYAALIKAVGVP